MPVLDLEPAAQRMAHLVAAVDDDQLQVTTPCGEYRVGDLLDHVAGLTKAFTWAAQKDLDAVRDTRPSGDAAHLSDDWRQRIPADLDDLVAAWRDPDAWTGMTQAGGIDMPGDVGGIVTLNELVIHGWDLARATAQPYEGDSASVEACHDFVLQFSGPGSEEAREGGFGPVVAVVEQAPLLDRLVGLAGRDPSWSPTR